MANDMNLQINITGQNDTGPSMDSFESALSGIQKLAMDVSKVFADFAKSVSGTMASASESVQEMVSPLQADQRELEVLIQSMGDVDRAAQTMGETASAVGREMQTSMESASQASRGLQTGLAGAQQGLNNTGSAASAASGSIDQLGQAISAEMIGEQLKSIGETGMKAFEECVGAAADFEYNISRIGAVLTTVGKASNQQMGQMSEDALKIGSTSSFSANQIAEGMYTLARQGLDASTILGDGVNGAINIVNDLAQATDSSMTDTATVITDVVHEYGLSGNSLREVANIMSGALHNSSESLDDFYQSMKQVGPIAANMHQNVNDMSTALALLAQHGITGSSAGTALKNMLLGLQPHTKKAAELMNELGISTKNGAADSFYQLNGNLKPLPEIIDILNQKFGGMNDAQKQAALAATFTKYGLAGLNVVVGESRDKFLAFQNELKADDAATIAGKKMDNLHGDLLKFNAGVQTMMKSFGDSINGMLRPIVQGASEAIKWITELPKPVKELGMAFLGIGSALAIAGGSVIAFAGGVKMLGPTLEMAGISTAGLEAAAGGLGAVFTGVLIPIAAAVAAVAAVALGFKLAYDHIKPFHDAVNNTIDAVKQFATAIQGLWQGGANGGKAVSILDNLGFSSEAISAFQSAIAAVKTGLADLGQAFDNVKSFAVALFEVVGGTGNGEGISILQKLGFGKDTIAQLMQIGGVFQATFNAIKTVVTDVITSLENTIKQGLTLIFNLWNQHGSQLSQTIQQVWNQIGNIARTAVSFLVSNISEGVTAIYKWWKQYWPEIQQVFQTVWTVMRAAIAPALAVITTVIIAAIGFIKGAWSSGWAAVGSILKAAWDLIKGVIQTAWTIISGIISVALDLLTGNFKKAGTDFVNTLKNAFTDILSLFTNLAKDAFNFGVNFVKSIASGITGSIGSVISAASSVVNSVKSFISNGVSGAISAVTSVVTGGVAKHATGGIFDQPHLGLVAEAGPEAIIPLSDPTRGLALWQQAGQMLGGFNQVNSMAVPSSTGSRGNVTIIVHANGNITRSEKDLGDIVAKALLNKTKLQGKIDL